MNPSNGEQPGQRVPQSHAKPYQSPLWEYLETIRRLRRKRQTWAAIALHLKESHGLATTSATVFKFFKRTVTGRIPIGFADVGKSPVAPNPSPNMSRGMERTPSHLTDLQPNAEPNNDPLLVEVSANDPFANLKKKYEQTRRANQ